MLQPNSRIENFKGLRFYEQDMLFDDYIYSNDIQIVMDIDYVSPGIGIALMNNEGKPLQEQKDIFLFRLGYRESTVTFRDVNVTKKLMSTANTLVPPLNNMKFTFAKIGKRVSITIDGVGKLIDYILPNNMDKYSIGIYSNAGNIIKDISIASSIPDYWNVNMRNTNGGHLRFIKNGFILQNCKNIAEIEQENIDLPAGEYFIKYETEGDTDIKCYAMLSGDDRLYDEEKNILDSNGKFVLKMPDKINIKFKGKYGTIKNIHNIDRVGDKYVATKNEQATVDGSYITIKIQNLSMVRWTGAIYGAQISTNPNDILSTIIVNGEESISYDVNGVLLSTEYDFEYNTLLHKLSILKNKTIVYQHTFAYRPSEIVIFKNVDAEINQLSLVQNNGEVINLIVEKTSKRYVPSSITSPIIVVDNEDIPLELSSSYRTIDIGDRPKYIFTNYEREIFESDTHIKLANKASADPGSVKVYGIPVGTEVNYNNIFKINEPGMDNISLFSKKYVLIKESDLHYIDKYTGDVYIDNADKYKLFVVDYLKRNSYCINYITESKMYEVDISTEAESTSLIYDHSVETSDNRIVTQINGYRITDITPEGKNYITLRREGF